VPDVLPFPGIRYDCDRAGAGLGMLAAPPYDVVDDDLHAVLEGNHERNSVRLILPRDETADGDRYERAASTFRAWLADGTLVRDPVPRYYGYRMRYRDVHGRDRHTHGLIGALALPDDGDATGVLLHERTLPKAKSDRLSLLSAMRVNVDPIWGLSLAGGLTDLLEPATLLCGCTDHEGVEHTLYAIDDPAQLSAITAAIASQPLVLADGHHRFETALAYRRQRRERGEPDGASAAAGAGAGAGAIMTFVVELAEEELCIEAIHRLVTLPAGVDVRAALADAFRIEDAGPNTPDVVEAAERRMAAERALGLVDGHGVALLHPRATVTTPALDAEPEAVRSTDAALVETVVVPRLAGGEWAYRNDAAACAALVDKGAAHAAVLCSPVSVAQTRAAALAGVRMPQKTTFFWPKPRTGMVFRSLD
jgi:uncharacterized protein (DUF1015 family)